MKESEVLYKALELCGNDFEERQGLTLTGSGMCSLIDGQSIYLICELLSFKLQEMGYTLVMAQNEKKKRRKLNER